MQLTSSGKEAAMSNKTADEKRFSNLTTSMFRQTKSFVPGRFRKKDFFSFFFSWVPDFSADFNALSEKAQTAYVNYATGSAGKLVRPLPMGIDYEPDRDDNGRLVVYSGVYDKGQRDAAKKAISEFYLGHGHEEAMKKTIQAALSAIRDLSEPDPALSEIDNLYSRPERNKFSNAYSYFQSRIDNGVDLVDILGELSWYTLCGHYNYPVSERPKPNVYIASKKVIENETDCYNLDDRCKDADHLLVIAFAATSFLAGKLVSKSTYSAKWTSFIGKLGAGKASIDFVILEHQSRAEQDAIDYKMRPLTLNKEVSLSDIVNKNMTALENDIKRSDLKNIHLYATKIALPVSYVIAEYNDDPSRDSLKCDLYLPILNNYYEDGEEYRLEDERFHDHTVRQSFVLYRNDPDTHELYEALRQNAYSILNSSRQII